MSLITIYGIKNCDTMKKAMKWLDKNGIAYDFHNYKKDGIDKNALEHALEQHGLNVVINKRGTTWQQLSDHVKDSVNESNIIALAEQNPSLLKRPLLMIGDTAIVGFNEQEYRNLF